MNTTKPLGNIQATIYMIGERGAEMLIQDNPIIG